ncbi:MAG: flagellar biosynthesis regulator FlaF [Xanthobacteraceae bacterium]
MPLKIELAPNERVLLGDCVITNAGPRTRLVVEGQVPILREKDILPARSVDTPAKQLYFAVQLMYASKRPQQQRPLCLRLARRILKAAPGTRPHIELINKRILTGELYKALKETRKLIAYEKEHRGMYNYANKAYTKTANEIAGPRALEANLLLQAAAKLQAVHDSWGDKPRGLEAALMFNRRLWTVFLDSVIRDDNKLPAQLRSNLTKIGAFVMGETFSLMSRPQPKHLQSIIKINRRIASGLSGKAA